MVQYSLEYILYAFVPISGTGFWWDISVSRRLKHTCHQKNWSLPLCLTMLGPGDSNINTDDDVCAHHVLLVGVVANIVVSAATAL